jgi:hypothetical protein
MKHPAFYELQTGEQIFCHDEGTEAVKVHAGMTESDFHGFLFPHVDFMDRAQIEAHPQDEAQAPQAGQKD